jgi:hypothetical protein
MVREVVEQRLPALVTLPEESPEPAAELLQEPAEALSHPAAPESAETPESRSSSSPPPADAAPPLPATTEAPAAAAPAPETAPPPSADPPARRESPRQSDPRMAPRPAGFEEEEGVLADWIQDEPEPAARPASSSPRLRRPQSADLPGRVVPGLSAESLLGFGFGGPGLPAPDVLPPPASSYFDLSGRLPISRRQLKQAWRGLRRTRRAGSSTELSVQGTIDLLYRDSVLVHPVFIPLRRNAARLLILEDRLGSMRPFGRACRAIVESAEQAGLGMTAVAYFHDVPAAPFHGDPALSEPLSLKPLLGAVAGGSILLVGDAGAARRELEESRVKRTVLALESLLATTSKICWLNPLPEERWEGTSAAAIRRATSVPMVPLTYSGFQTALAILRGKTVF